MKWVFPFSSIFASRKTLATEMSIKCARQWTVNDVCRPSRIPFLVIKILRSGYRKAVWYKYILYLVSNMYAYAFNLSKKENNSKNFSANYKPFSNFELKEFFFERCCLRKQPIYKLRSSYEVELWRHSFPEFIPSHVVILNVTISNIPNTYLQKKKYL